MARFASPVCGRYHELLMPVALRKLLPTSLAVLILLAGLALKADDTPAIFPLSQVQPGMKGVVYTIFTGDEIEKVDLVVLGVLHNAIGPRQDIILVQLLGEKVEHTGVVAGMSGSPVYFDGKLAGALSLKLGVFTKEAIGGVTPIQNMLDVENAPEPPSRVSPPIPGAQPANTGNGRADSCAFRFLKISRDRLAPASANFWFPSRRHSLRPACTRKQSLNSASSSPPGG